MNKKTIPFKNIQAGDTIHLLHRDGHFYPDVEVAYVDVENSRIKASNNTIYDLNYFTTAILVKRPLPSEIGAVHGNYVRVSEFLWVRKNAKVDCNDKIHTYTNQEVERENSNDLQA